VLHEQVLRKPTGRLGAHLNPPGGKVHSMQVTGTAQHEAWQRRDLPPVEQLRPDLWSIPVPIPHNPLRYVSVYALALAGGGIGLLDAGWDSDAGWEALTAGLDRLGAAPTDVRGVLVTHLHFDHLGLAGRIREASGAWIAMHPADASVVRRMNGRTAAAAAADEVDFLIHLGADPDEAHADADDAEAMEPFMRMAAADRLLADGELADLPGWQLRALHTPATPPGTCASTRSAPDCCSAATTSCRGSVPTSPRPRMAPQTRCGPTWPRSPPSETSRRRRCCPPTSGASTGSLPGSTSSRLTTSTGSTNSCRHSARTRTAPRGSWRPI